MAKGQKKSNRETRKPKQAKPKVEAAPRSFLGTSERGVGKPPAGAKRSGG